MNTAGQAVIENNPTNYSSPAAESTNPSAIQIADLNHTYPATSGSKRRTRRQSAKSQNASEVPHRPALDGVNLRISPGEIFGILGPNGGGKTTLFRILSTLLRPTSGNVAVFGYDVCAQPWEVRKQLGVVFQSPSLDVKLTAKENLRCQGHMYGLRGSDLNSRIDKVLEQVGLPDAADRHVEILSGGMRRRVELAKAMLHAPPLLLLDEPSTGLDVGARRDLWEQLETLRHKQGVTIALTTHLMDEADRCDRLAVLHEGKLVALDTPAQLKAKIGGEVVTIEPTQGQAQGLLEQITDRFGPWDNTTKPVLIDGVIHLEKSDGPGFVATLAGAFPDSTRSITVGHPTLEDVFLHLTGQTLRK